MHINASIRHQMFPRHRRCGRRGASPRSPVSLLQCQQLGDPAPALSIAADNFSLNARDGCIPRRNHRMVAGSNRWRRDLFFADGVLRWKVINPEHTYRTLMLLLSTGSGTARRRARCGNSIGTVPVAPSSAPATAAGHPLAAQITD